MIHDNHFHHEQFHRATKQVCNIERLKNRTTVAIKNHLFWERSAFVQLEFMRFHKVIINWYEIQKNLFNEVIRAFITDNLENIDIMTESIKV